MSRRLGGGTAAGLLLANLLSAGAGVRSGGLHAARQTLEPPAGVAWFTDRAEEVGIDFGHFNGASGELYVSEILGPGAAMFDFDGDGDLDLFEGNDYGANELWDNRGDGTFRALEDHPAAGDASNTMGVAVADWDNSGRWSLHLSNMYSHAGRRVVRLAQTLGGAMRGRLGQLANGNQLFVQAPGGWEERAAALGVNEAGWAWASLFYDLDNDGDQELFVTNGNTSHRDAEAPDY